MCCQAGKKRNKEIIWFKPCDYSYFKRGREREIVKIAKEGIRVNSHLPVKRNKGKVKMVCVARLEKKRQEIILFKPCNYCFKRCRENVR